MATGWAVGSAACLALSLAFVMFGVAEPGDPEGGESLTRAFRLQTLLWMAPLVYAPWAYALSVGAHGSKAALVALAGYVGAWSLGLGALRLTECVPHLACGGMEILFQALNVVAAVPTLVALAAEVRRRRGAIQWGTALALLAPLALVLVVMAAVSLA